MQNQTMLFLMTEGTPDTEINQMADLAAAQNARLICFDMALLPPQPMDASGGFPYVGLEISAEWVRQINSLRSTLADRANALEQVLQRAGCPGDVQTALHAQSDMRAAVARRALASDIAVMASNLRDADDGLFRLASYGVLFDAPIPLLMNAAPLTLPKRVLVAWDGELPAARAVHAALPYLVRADDVIIVSFDPDTVDGAEGENPGSELATWLSHHGCSVTVAAYPSGGQEIGAALQARAAELGADLVVMGAFGRSRLHELVFGGTTRTMLEQSRTPVLMAH